MNATLRSVRNERHVHCHIYMGETPNVETYVGQLIFTVGEWQVFGAALILGAKQMHGQFTVTTEGDEEVVGA